MPVHSLVCVMTSIHYQNNFSQPPPKYYHRIWLYKEMGVLLGGEGLLHTCTAFKARCLWCILPLGGNSPKCLDKYVPPNGVVILGHPFWRCFLDKWGLVFRPSEVSNYQQPERDVKKF